MLKRILIPFSLVFLLQSCADEPQKPEEVLQNFLKEVEAKKSISSFINNQELGKDFLATRKWAEFYNLESISCETIEDEADCNCKTKSGNTRKFKLKLTDDGWVIDLTQPEIILEIFHLSINNNNLTLAQKNATPTERERLVLLMDMLDKLEVKNTKTAIIPFTINCKKYKKKMECACEGSDGITLYNLYFTKSGWLAEMANQSFLDIASDSITDYNSSEDFNLNQRDLDSLTDFSRQMLDSMLNL